MAVKINDIRSQKEKFEDAARHLETDDSETRFDEKLRKIAKIRQDGPKSRLTEN